MKKLLGNQSGVALIMVMTAILILMALWGDFTFESKISRIKTTNMLDKSQSRMMAETALDFAIVRLRLYKEAYNSRVSNQNVAASVPVQLLNQLWETPFVYPVPVGANAGAQVKDAVGKFEKDSFLQGEMKLSIQNISNKLNINMMRLSQLDKIAQPGRPVDTDGDGVPDASDTDPNDPNVPTDTGASTTAKDPNFSMEQQLLKHLQRRLRDKGEEDETFRDRYGSVDPIQLVANLKFYISDRNTRRQNTSQVDMMMDNAEQLFAESKVSPKYGPLSSFSEIYLIPGWDDDLVELIKSEFDVFPLVMIDLNRLTSNMLQMLIPNINEDEIREFFRWRDNPEKPQFFNSKDDFKNYLVTTASILSESAFNDLFNKYEAQGIQFGTSPTLFRVLAEGSLNNSTTTLVATVSLPATPKTAPAAAATPPANGSDPGATAPTKPVQKDQPLLDPRIIDLQFN